MMGAFLSLFVLPFHHLIQFHNQIDGEWLKYLSIRWKLKKQQSDGKILPKHDLMQPDPRHVGVLSFDEEWRLEWPEQIHYEDIFIYGLNSSGQHLKLSFKWRPQDDGFVKGAVEFEFTDSEGNKYYVSEEETKKTDKIAKEYKVGGVALEVLSPMRRHRIKVRGFLKKNGQLVYVKLRLIWLAISNTFEFASQFDDHFLALEMLKQNKNNLQFENRWEQVGQIKGTLQVENEKSKELYYWGARAKTFLPKNYVDTEITRILGHTKTGQAIHIGVVNSRSQNQSYRFGYGKLFYANTEPLTGVSLTSQEIESLTDITEPVQFTAYFGNEYGRNKFEIKIEPNNNKDEMHQMTVNGFIGKCLIVAERGNEWQSRVPVVRKELDDTCKSLVLSLDDDRADSVEQAGGKGASLAHLLKLASRTPDSDLQFLVPRGVVVTTNAYHLLVAGNLKLANEIENLQKNAWSLERDNLKSVCEKVVEFVSETALPIEIENAIEEELVKLFGNDYNNLLFAVRSSAAGEDSEEMSAAGQMTSYLGVKGLNEISKSVMKCWASQFAFVPVEYKRGYGQLINTPMAVVIQEMVDCDAAGVIFTCDPVTGDERLMTVTANYGLGETVVSASAEPDTIKLQIDVRSNVLSQPRRVIGIESKEVGSKQSILKLGSDGGTVEKSSPDSAGCCISDQLLVRLGGVALHIHRHYGNARDIEWGVRDQQLFMLQSRPVTNLDNSFTEYELIHELDSPHSSEIEIMSRLHMAESFPKTSSLPAINLIWTKGMDGHFVKARKNMFGLNTSVWSPFVNQVFQVQYNQIFIGLRTSFFDFLRGYPDQDFAREGVKGFFGMEITDPDVLDMIKETEQYKPKFTKKVVLTLIYFMVSRLIMVGYNLKKFRQKFFKEHDLVRNVKSKGTSRSMFNELNQFVNCGTKPVLNHHGDCSMTSGIKSTILKGFLKRAKNNNPDVETDYNTLISTCNEVVSCEGPKKIRQIAVAIQDKDKFKDLSDDEALEQLKNGQSLASKIFLELLEVNGHRGFAECDPRYLPWRDDPRPVVKSIKMLLRGGDQMLKEKQEKSVDEILSSLKTQLTGINYWLVKKWILPWVRNGVGYREQSRDAMIWELDQIRQALWHMAKKMVTEGLIPDPELLFFLTAEEMEKIVNHERDPLILIKARLRRATFKKTDSYKYEDFCKGYEFKPINLAEYKVPVSDGQVKVTGTSVCNGYVKARVCVAEDLYEAENIQPGDILVTFATDIGWSPYLPLISGLVTEIGGTISHGAVVAREFGIPCLIAVKNACRIFKTGDVCVLDTENCQIFKVD